MKIMQGAKAAASWNSCRTFASDSPGRPYYALQSGILSYAGRVGVQCFVTQQKLVLLWLWIHMIYNL